MISGHEGRLEDDNGPPNMYVDTSHRSHYYYVITIYCLEICWPDDDVGKYIVEWQLGIACLIQGDMDEDEAED